MLLLEEADLLSKTKACNVLMKRENLFSEGIPFAKLKNKRRNVMAHADLKSAVCLCMIALLRLFCGIGMIR